VFQLLADKTAHGHASAAGGVFEPGEEFVSKTYC